jgi:hypothetical protein
LNGINGDSRSRPAILLLLLKRTIEWVVILTKKLFLFHQFAKSFIVFVQYPPDPDYIYRG